MGIAQVTSIAQKGFKKKNAKGLVRVGEMLNNALDRLQDDFGITGAVLPGWQIIAQIMSIYIMFRCGNLYLLVFVKDVTIPDCLTDLKTLFELISRRCSSWKQRLRSDCTVSSNRLPLARGKPPLGNLFFLNEFQLLEPQNSRPFSPRNRQCLTISPILVFHFGISFTLRFFLYDERGATQ